MRSRFLYYLCASVMLHLFALLYLPWATIGGGGTEGMLPVRVHLLSGDGTAPEDMASESAKPAEADARPIAKEEPNHASAEDAIKIASPASESDTTRAPDRNSAELQPIPAEPEANLSPAEPSRASLTDVQREAVPPPASKETSVSKPPRPAVLRTTTVYRGTRAAASAANAGANSAGAQAAAAPSSGGQEHQAPAPKAPGEPLQRARYARVVKPDYPEEARLRGWEGTTLLRVLVNPAGRSDEIEVQRSSGFDLLDHAAVDALWRWEFHPAHRGAHAVRSWVQVPVVFKLEEEN